MESGNGFGAPAEAGRRIGYARVSTEEQNLSLQLDALKAAGCDRIFHDDGFGGALLDRPALDRALTLLKPGDALVVWKLDRLGRSLAHLIDIVAGLAQREVGFCSLTESIDTATAGGRLLFHVLGALAEFERALISERTKAGMASARARGALIGRPCKLTPRQISDARKRLQSNGAGLAEIADIFGVSPVTLARALKRQDAAA